MYNPEDIHEEVRRILRARQMELHEQIGEFTPKKPDQENVSPIKKNGGLSPSNMFRLLNFPIGSEYCPVVLNKDIGEEELAEAVFYHDCKKVINMIVGKSRVKATVTGNFNREFVDYALDILGDDWEIRKYCKVINEEDFFKLHKIRIILNFAGIIKKNNGYIIVTQKAKDYIDGKKKGLYALLFQAFFGRLNLAYLDRFDDFPEVQNTVNFSIYMARERCSEFVDALLFSRMVLYDGLGLNIKYKDYLSRPYMKDRLELVHGARFINPMLHFGLFEKNNKKQYKIRKSRLLDRFIDFRF